MSAAALTSQLNEHISYMYATGILDEYYQQLQSPQDEGFVPEVINIFLHDADRMLNDITSLLNLSVVDFKMVGELVHQLKSCSCRCLMAWNLLRNEFYDVRGRLQTIMQGAVDAYFQQLQELDEGSAGTGYVAEVLNIFLNDGDRILRDIDGLLNQPLHEVDFSKVDALVQQLKGSSSTVVAKKVNLACMDFQKFYVAKNKKGCLMTLALLKGDFCDVRNKLQTLMQLEQQIASLVSMW